MTEKKSGKTNLLPGILLAIFLGLFLFVSCQGGNWRTASREPAGIAPNPGAVEMG